MLKLAAIKRYAGGIFSYRELIFNLVVKDLKVRYKTATLGFLWALLNPLLMMMILSIVFSVFIKLQIEKYPLFLLAALLPWYFLSQSLSCATTSIVDNANLIRKIPFPREIIPLSVIIAQFIFFLLSLMILFIFLVIFKIGFTLLILYLPLVLLVQFVFVSGISLITSALHVRYRDVKYIIEALLLCWFYLTPVFYPLSLVPQQFQRIYMLNPMACIVTIYRDVLLYGGISDFYITWYTLSVSLVFLIAGLFIFKKTEHLFADAV